MGFRSNKKLRALILTMIALTFTVISFSYFYYKNVNAQKDPRIKPAREMYEKYNDYAIQNDFENIFSLLDSVEFIYNSVKHYSKSFEVGVLYNNRAAAYLTMALYKDEFEQLISLSKDSLLNLSQIAVEKSIAIYENWLKEYGDKNPLQIKEHIAINYFEGLEKYNNKTKNQFLKHRLKEIKIAQYETKRRLSVSYTNLGIIYRHKEQYKEAIIYYQKAIELWDRNLTAENNLNILLGKPLRERNLIEKLFPPERKIK